MCSSEDDIIDLAIIGAGITGSFSAWRLRNNFSKISLFEYSDRIGGKIYTANLSNGTKVELGAMRVHPQEHNLIMKLLNETGMKVPFWGVPPAETGIYYIHGTRKRMNEKITSSSFPYQVRLDETNRSSSELLG